MLLAILHYHSIFPTHINLIRDSSILLYIFFFSGVFASKRIGFFLFLKTIKSSGASLCSSSDSATDAVSILFFFYINILEKKILKRKHFMFMWKRLCLVYERTLQTFYLFVTPKSNLFNIEYFKSMKLTYKKTSKTQDQTKRKSCRRSTKVESHALYITYQFTCLWPVVHVKWESSIEGNVIVKYRVPVFYCELKWLDWKKESIYK